MNASWIQSPTSGPFQFLRNGGMTTESGGECVEAPLHPETLRLPSFPWICNPPRKSGTGRFSPSLLGHEARRQAEDRHG